MSWVWCPTAEGFIRGDAPAFYPGDDQVDWTCVDVYAGNVFQPIGKLMGPFLQWAAQRPKPIIIGEFGVAKAWGSAGRAAWLRDAERTFKANPQIKGGRLLRVRPGGQRAEAAVPADRRPARVQGVRRRMTKDPYFNPLTAPACRRSALAAPDGGGRRTRVSGGRRSRRAGAGRTGRRGAGSGRPAGGARCPAGGPTPGRCAASSVAPGRRRRRRSSPPRRSR